MLRKADSDKGAKVISKSGRHRVTWPFANGKGPDLYQRVNEFLHGLEIIRHCPIQRGHVIWGNSSIDLGPYFVIFIIPEA